MIRMISRYKQLLNLTRRLYRKMVRMVRMDRKSMVNETQKREVWLITVKPVDDAIPADVRVANALKALLRQYGLRAVDVQQRKGDNRE